LELDNWEHLHNFNADNYKASDVDLDLSPEQERLVELVEEFDKQMKDKYGDAEGAEDTDGGPRKPLDIEPKIGGLSLKNTSTSVKFIYLLVIFGIIGLVIYLAFGKLFTPTLSVYEQKKAEKQERKKFKEKEGMISCGINFTLNQ